MKRDTEMTERWNYQVNLKTVFFYMFKNIKEGINNMIKEKKNIFKMNL